jgi:hypothetical protein
MTEQLIEDGAVLTTEGGAEIQCVAARYEENPDGTRHSYQYIFRAKSEIDAERKAEEARQAEIAQAEADSIEANKQLNNEEGDQ